MITTKVGDGGKSWCGGKMVDKDGPLLEAMGSLDELQAGLMMVDEKKIVKDLKEIMGIIASLSSSSSLSSCKVKDKVEWLEREIKKMDKGDVEEFLVFETKKAREFNLVRTVCRRAERRLVGYGKVGKVDKGILIYINRLSDYLFLKAVLNN
ncbi:MAG TPA: ATP:cob(I)alamin adenosyltransferase [Candidatus Woesebacteria bacterium]|nr:ATP:cob(I)alamin adenosyltransferase [Candidatus Woesebacteria bacterium]HOG37690.1 ATP:cob(I)alamin adenosyltransferase [Candidatus Woesebacteria bacterium]